MLRAALMALAAATFAVALAAAQPSETPTPGETTVIQTPAEAQPGAKIIEVPPAPPPQRPRRRAAAKQEETPAQLPAAVTDEDIAVTSDYRGADVTVYGYNPDARGRGDIVVALRGPNQPAVVRRKFRFLMFWVNGDPVAFQEAPSYLAVYSTRPLRQIASPRLIWTLRLDPAASARLAGSTPPDANPADYRRALVRLRREQNLYIENPKGLTRHEGNALFRAEFSIPANAPIGQYTADVYLFRDQRLIGQQTSKVIVDRAGLERTIYSFALDWPFIYGLAAVILALGAGWLSSVFFRRA